MTVVTVYVTVYEFQFGAFLHQASWQQALGRTGREGSTFELSQYVLKMVEVRRC